MAVTEKLKGMVEELRQDLKEVKEQVKQLLPAKKDDTNVPVRYQAPDTSIATLQRETNRLFDDFLRGSLSPLSSPFPHFADFGESAWPRIDIDESKTEIRIKADLAGMDRDDVDVSVADGMLTIRGEKKLEEEDVGRHHFRRECFYGSFSRSVPVPAEVDLDRIDGTMKQGVLLITMAKLADRKTRGRSIPISSDRA